MTTATLSNATLSTTPTATQASAASAGPKRWPINTDIIDSPACAMPQYANYRRHLYLVTGSILEVGGETLDEVLDRGVPFAREGSRIVRVPVVPHYDNKHDHNGRREGYRAVGSAPWAGGTWGGRCGSTIWVRDTDYRYRNTFAALSALADSSGHMQDEPTSSHDVDKLQAWWVNGVARKYEPVLDGFWVECTHKRKGHPALCSALDIEWNWRDYAPWTDRGHNTQLPLDLSI